MIIENLDHLEKRYRANLVNSISGYKSANLIGTIDNEGRTNLALFSSMFHIGADPALFGMISRPNSVPRHTIENIRETKVFTVNHVNKEIYENAHQTSSRFDKDQSEFEAVKLTEEYLKDFQSPFVKESNVKFAATLKEIIHLDINNTDLIIGEIDFICLDENYLTTGGRIDIIKASSVWVNGLDTYGVGNKLGSLSYAKPSFWPKQFEAE